MRSPKRVDARPLDRKDVRLEEVEVKQGEFNRFLYQLVGQHWAWHDKDSCSLQQWRDYAERDGLRTWLLTVKGSPAGYFELERQEGNKVEIKSFGLAKPFIGEGLGGAFLTAAIEAAWNWADAQGRLPDRIWLHTCSDDHPNALANYQARGFEIFKTEVED